MTCSEALSPREFPIDQGVKGIGCSAHWLDIPDKRLCYPQPSTSFANAVHSPPPNRHPPLPTNPDDRPLPKPKQLPWSQAGPSNVNLAAPTQRPVVSIREPARPTSRQGSVMPSFSLKGKERAINTDMESDSPGDVARLNELQGQINLLEGERQTEEQRRRGFTGEVSLSGLCLCRMLITVYDQRSNPIPLPQTKKPPSTSRTPNPTSKSRAAPKTPVSYPTPSAAFQAGSHRTTPGSGSSSESPRGALHASTNLVPVPLDATPMIKKNREMRKEQNLRRKSSLGLRTARVSESLGAGILGGLLTFPDNITLC